MVTAGWVHKTLLFRMAEMEAAVAHYWDRIRKRMGVPGILKEPIPQTENEQAYERARRAALEIPHAGRES